jgi:hypothetical protein
MRPAADSMRRRRRDALRGKDVQEVAEMKRQGMSIQAISKLLSMSAAASS